MSNLLAIDTALSACSVALLTDGQVSVQRESAPRQHIKRLLPMIDALLAENTLQLKDVDALAFNCGPGSFTGLRIGMGVIQGLAMGADLPVLPISTLQALAQRAIDGKDVCEQEIIMPVIDARMDEVYWGAYQNCGGLARPLLDDRLSAPEEISNIYLSIFKEGTGRFQHSALIDKTLIAVGLGDGWTFRERILLEPRIVDTQACSDAEQTLRLAFAAFERGEARTIDEVEPMYLRNKTTWKKRQRLRT